MTSLTMLLLVALFGGPQDHADEVAAPAPSAKPVEEDKYANNACVQCHRNLAGRSAEIVDVEWVQSVHYRNNVACDGCHGGDASLTRDQFPTDDAFKQAAHLARNPEFLTLTGDERGFVSRARGRSVSYFCGRCHTEIMEKHLGSPHGNFGDPSCLYCHGQGSHAIQYPSIDIIDTRGRAEGGRCAPCHQAATMTVVRDIKEILKKTTERIDSSAARFAELEDLGYKNLALGEMHHHTADTHSRLRRVFHSFNMRDINDLARSIESVAKQTDYAYDLVHALRRARRTQAVMGVAAVGFLLAFAGLLVFFKKGFLDKEHHPVPPPGDAESDG